MTVQNSSKRDREWYRRCYPEFEVECPGCHETFNQKFEMVENGRNGRYRKYCGKPECEQARNRAKANAAHVGR